jgi:3-hydroxyacyl-[acyl-carrier-protein] dehydratase
MSYVFIDRVAECEPGQRVVALKALAYNEEFFRDHFPGRPVVPGAMILEGFVQAAQHCLGEGEWVLHAVEQMRFNRFASPGDVLRLEAERSGEKDGAIWFKARGTVDGEGVCRMRFGMRPATS